MFDHAFIQFTEPYLRPPVGVNPRTACPAGAVFVQKIDPSIVESGVQVFVP